MAKLTDVRPIAAAVYFLPIKTRMPLKFGPEVTTEVTCAPFTSGCSPPRLAATQLPSVTECQNTPAGTFTLLIRCNYRRTGSRVSRRFLQQLPPGHGGPRHWRFGPPAAQGPRARLPGHDHCPLGRHGCRRQSPGPDWRHDCRRPRCTVRSPPADETSNPPGDGRGERTRLAAPARSCRGAVVEHDGSTRDRPIVV